MKISEIWKQKQETTNRKMFNSPVLQDITCMAAYDQNYEKIDKFIVNKFANFFLFNALGENDITFFDDAWKAYFIMNADNFQRIYDGLLIEYNPVENYDKHSTITTEYKGSEKDELTKAGSEKDELTRTGSEKTENSYTGKERNTVTNPADGYNDITSTAVAPEDSESYFNKEKTTSHIDHREDISEMEYENRKDTSETSFTDRKDTQETSFINRKDTNEKTFQDREDEVNEYTHGNIGVSESSEILSNEIQMRLANSFYPLIFTKFFKEVTII